MGIKFCHEWPHLPCRWTVLHCLRTVSSQHLLSSSSRREERGAPSKRTPHLKTLAGFPSCQTAAPAALWSTWSSPLLALSFIQAPLYIFLLKHHTSHWMIGKPKKGWLMLLHSEILISRWFVVPSSLVCRDGRGSQKLCLCLEPNKELSHPAECVLECRNGQGDNPFQGSMQLIETWLHSKPGALLWDSPASCAS